MSESLRSKGGWEEICRGYSAIELTRDIPKSGALHNRFRHSCTVMNRQNGKVVNPTSVHWRIQKQHQRGSSWEQKWFHSFLHIAKSTLMLSAKYPYINVIFPTLKTRTTFFATFIFKESGYHQNDKKNRVIKVIEN